MHAVKNVGAVFPATEKQYGMLGICVDVRCDGLCKLLRHPGGDSLAGSGWHLLSLTAHCTDPVRQWDTGFGRSVAISRAAVVAFMFCNSYMLCCGIMMGTWQHV